MMRKKRARLWSDDLREAIRSAPMSLSELGRQTNIDKAVLSKFVNGKVGLSVGSIDSLCQFLGLGLSKVSQAKKGR